MDMMRNDDHAKPRQKFIDVKNWAIKIAKAWLIEKYK